MLGNAKGEPRGYLNLDKDFNIIGHGKTRWATSRSVMISGTSPATM